MQDLDTVVAALEDIALLLSLSGQDGFKARAYRRGAELVLARGDELGTLVAQAALSEVEGIGPSLSKQITELWNTGRSSLLRRLEPGGVTPHGATNGQMRVIALTRKGRHATVAWSLMRDRYRGATGSQLAQNPGQSSRSRGS